jgi:hypothetical protein
MPALTAEATAPRAGAATRAGLPGAAAVLVVGLMLPWLLQISAYDALLAGLNVALSTIGFVRGWHPAARPVQTITFGFLTAYLGVAPIYQLAHDAAAWSDSALFGQYPADVTLALILDLLGTIALLIGFTLGGRRRTSVPGVRPTLRHRSARVAVVRPQLPWLLLAAAAAVTPATIAAAGGIGGFFSNRYERADQLAAKGLTLSDAGGAQVALVSLVPAALALASAYLFLISVLPRTRDQGLLSVPTGRVHGLVAAILLTLLHVNPFTSSRFLFILAVGALVLVAVGPRSPRAGRVLAAVTVLGTLVVYPLANLFRTQDFQLSSGFQAFATPDFDGFQQVVNSISFVRDIGHSWGLYSVSALGYFVPRSIWHGKAFPASEDVAAHRGYVFTNLSQPFDSEMYVEFGVVGMVVVLLALGWALGRLDTAWLDEPLSIAAMITPAFALAMLGVVRGPLGANTPIYLTFIGLAVLGFRLDTLARSRGPSHAPDVPRRRRRVSRV